MAYTVSKVTNAYKDYVDENGTKGRFKIAFTTSAGETFVSKKSFEFVSNVNDLLKDYASGKNGETIEDFRIERGVKYKINGVQYRDNYNEIVIKVSALKALGGSKLEKLINEGLRVCHAANSRDRHVNEIVTSMGADA